MRPGKNSSSKSSWGAPQFSAWRERMGYTQAQAAESLGITARMVRFYESGINGARLDPKGRPEKVTVPRAIALACRAIEHGLDLI